ncbi:MAG TPA: alpha/beta hydrolase [Pyrinomonadaceae bacterium]|nr:alpha/beta hydrolase [Pyrinomonadaceae bacterium]
MPETEIPFTESGKGIAVVLLHGYPFDKSMWSAQLHAIADAGFRAIAPDLRGLGENKSSGEVASMDDMARDVAALLNQLEVEQAVICGLSMGGYVAFEFMQLFPARVLGLVLAGTRAPADNDQEKAGREQQVQTMLRSGMVPISIATLPKLLAPRTLAEKPDVVKRVRAMITTSDPKGAAAAQRGMAARRDYTDDLGKINVPTLIIVGREDSIRPIADAELMHRGIRNSRLEIIEDAAHMTNMEQPEVFDEALLTFLKELT